jgi:hypothetical protein
MSEKGRGCVKTHDEVNANDGHSATAPGNSHSWNWHNQFRFPLGREENVSQASDLLRLPRLER